MKRHSTLRRAGWSCLLATTLAACGTTDGGGGSTTLDMGNGNTGGTPVGGAGGAPVGGMPVGGTPVGGTPVGGTPVGGEGGTGGTPVGGEGGTGGTPVGGTGGTGGTPVGGTEADAGVVTPDAAVVVTPDAAVVTPDAAVVTPDAAVVTPDAAVVVTPDAAPPEPDAAPAPVYACGNLPVEDLVDALTPVDATHWTLVGNLPNGPSETTGVCGGGGPEKVYGFTVPADGVYRFDTFGVETDFDTVLYLVDPCPTQPDGQNLRCSDDVGSLASGFLKTLRAGEVVYLVVDAFGPTGGNFRLNVGQLPVLGERQVCDAFSERDGCDDNLYCFALNVPGQLPAEEGVCVPAENPPVINRVAALRDGDVLGVSVDASDGEADVSGQYILELLAGNRAQVIDAQTGATEVTLNFRENPLGAQNFVGTARLNIFAAGAWPNTTAVRVRVLDVAGNVSASSTAQVAQVPVVNAAQPCDLGRVLNKCAAPNACIDRDGAAGAGPASCGLPTPPSLNSADTTINVNTATIATTFIGTDPDHDTEGFVIGFFDAQGMLIDPPGPQTFAFDDISWNGDTFTAHVRLRLSAAEAAMVALGVIVFDASELSSNQVTVEQFGNPVAVGRGAVCDLFNGARDVCSAGNLCHSDLFGAGDGTCQAPVAACPEFWPVADLNDAPVGVEWRASGSLADAANRTTATCANMSAQDIFTFTAPAAGTYRFRTESDEVGADTSIFVRSFCRYRDFGAELACNDDVSPQNFLSDLSVDLVANETVYVFVGGVNNAAQAKGSFRGRYRLIAARR